MRRIGKLIILLSLTAAAAIAVWLVRDWRAMRNFEPLVTDHATNTVLSLPEHTVVINASDATELVAPMLLLEDHASAGGKVIALPSGSVKKNMNGLAGFEFKALRAGRYRAWVHSYWRHSCANSCSLTVDNSTAYTVGQDAVFNAWHWVKAGSYDLEEGTHDLKILGREDGIRIAQVLLTDDKEFMPSGIFVPVLARMSERTFADNFARSPGHGMEAWNLLSGQWDISFTLDPNRVPNQYSLVGTTGTNGACAVALIDGPAWKGCSIGFSASPQDGGEFGAVLEHNDQTGQTTRVVFKVSDESSTVRVTGPGLDAVHNIGRTVRPEQWHRVKIERWAWSIRVTVDDNEVFSRYDLAPGAGGLGLLVVSGTTVFDDVAAKEILWQAEDGGEFRIPWTVSSGAKWYRAKQPGGDVALLGENGEIRTHLARMPIREVMLAEAGESNCVVKASMLSEISRTGDIRIFRATSVHEPEKEAGSSGAFPPPSLVLSPSCGKTRIRRAAVSYGRDIPNVFHLGPYHFTSNRIEDPSDYLDFTPEEYAEIKKSPDFRKLVRQQKYRSLVGRSRDDGTVWTERHERWRVSKGLLSGSGPGAILKFWQEVNGAVEITFKIRHVATDAITEWELHAGPDQGARIRIANQVKDGKDTEVDLLYLQAPADSDWHNAKIRIGGGRLSASIDGDASELSLVRQYDGGEILLKALAGSIEIDDIEFTIPRSGPRGYFYAFDQRESDWWREGTTWIDHGGISCVLASNWISLSAPKDKGTIWNKRVFDSDLLVACNVEERSDWYGWHEETSHVHYPFDNITIFLAGEVGSEDGYRIEFNSRNRTATVLYRNGVEVALTSQDKSFPMQYVGQHQPYLPRRSRVSLVKRGNTLRAIVNGVQVLRFEDPEPLNVSRVGLGGYNTQINFSHIEVIELERAEKSRRAAP